MLYIKLLCLPVLAYGLGSIPAGLVFTRLFIATDIRKIGSGNIGATNVRRAAGTPLALLVLMADVGKGALPVWLAAQLFPSNGLERELYISLVALAAFMGHLFPVYLKARGGGKGVATAAGCFLVLSPGAVVVSLLTFVLLVCLSRRVSAGSLAGSAVLPLAVWYASGSYVWTVCAAIMALCIFMRHWENILRLAAGKEPTIGSKRPN